MSVDLTEADMAILNHLQDGARTQGFLVDKTGYSRPHIHNRLQVLLAAGHIRLIHESTALYELVADPRQGDKK